MGMSGMKAHVVNGHSVSDERVDLPEGTPLVMEVVGTDDETPEERAEIEAAINEALDDFDAGRIVDEETVRAMLRAHR
jgi:hypothetical protein